MGLLRLLRLRRLLRHLVAESPPCSIIDSSPAADADRAAAVRKSASSVNLLCGRLIVRDAGYYSTIV